MSPAVIYSQRVRKTEKVLRTCEHGDRPPTSEERKSPKRSILSPTSEIEKETLAKPKLGKNHHHEIPRTHYEKGLVYIKSSNGILYFGL